MHDILVIGGGINGTGIARDAAGRGLDVVLCENGVVFGALEAGGVFRTEFLRGDWEFFQQALVSDELRTFALRLAAAGGLLRAGPAEARDHEVSERLCEGVGSLPCLLGRRL